MKDKPTSTGAGAMPTSSPSPTIAPPAEGSVVVSADGRSTKRLLDAPTATTTKGTGGRRAGQSAPQKKAAEAAFEAAISRPTLYEMANRGSGYGLAVVLRDGSVFWSKGWKMCSQGCRVPLDNWTHRLHYTEVKRAGVVVKRYTCTITLRTTGG